MATEADLKSLEGVGEYRYGFNDPDTSVFKSSRGLSREVVEMISHMKGEPEWMLEFRLKALEHFNKRPMPTWGGDLTGLDLDNIFFYVKPSNTESKSWDDVPDTIKKTFDRLGIPDAEEQGCLVDGVIEGVVTEGLDIWKAFRNCTHGCLSPG